MKRIFDVVSGLGGPSGGRIGVLLLAIMVVVVLFKAARDGRSR